MALRNTVTFTHSKVILQNMLKALTAIPAAALFATPKMRLFSGVTVPGLTNAVADFTTGVFSGYADQALTISVPVNIGLTGVAVAASPLFLSPGSGAFTPDVITGYILFDGALAYYGGERFASPVSFGAFGDFLAMELLIPLQGFQPAS